MERILAVIISEEELKKLENHLSDSEYRKALKQVRAKMRKSSDGKVSNRMAERLKCLKEWLSKP